MRLQARKVARELDRLRQDIRRWFADSPDSTPWPICSETQEWAERLDQCLLLLALPKRKVVRDPAKAARRTTVKELDALAREVVFLRDRDTCRRCGKPAVDWSHVYTRGIHAVRWDLDGSYASCKGCHLWWHRHPADAAMWWEKEIGPGRMADLSIRANGKGRRKVNHEAVRAYLMDERKRYA